MKPVTYRLGDEALQTEPTQPAFHRWPGQDGGDWTQFFRVPGGYLLRFPGIADFLVDPLGEQVCAHPTPGSSPGTIHHLYLHQVLPLALSRQGQLVLHAGAVAWPGAGAVAFLGASGQGKSTLTTAMALKGAPMLTDDGLQVQWLDGRCLVLPSEPAVRLWSDSEAALVPDAVERHADVHYTDKARLLAGSAIPFCPEPTPLRRVFVLGDGDVDRVEIAPIKPAAAVIALMRNTFLLDVTLQASLAWHFDAISRLAQLSVFYSLDYPRRYDLLDDVHRAVAQHLAAHEPL